MLAVGSKAFFRLHYHDAVELAGELSTDEKKRYVKLLTMLDSGEAVVRLGSKRPVLLMVPTHRAAKPTGEETQQLRKQSAARFTRLRSEIHKEQEPELPTEMERGNQTIISNELSTYADKD
jgi:hypothetical protein